MIHRVQAGQISQRHIRVIDVRTGIRGRDVGRNVNIGNNKGVTILYFHTHHRSHRSPGLAGNDIARVGGRCGDVGGSQLSRAVFSGITAGILLGHHSRGKAHGTVDSLVVDHYLVLVGNTIAGLVRILVLSGICQHILVKVGGEGVGLTGGEIAHSGSIHRYASGIGPIVKDVVCRSNRSGEGQGHGSGQITLRVAEIVGLVSSTVKAAAFGGHILHEHLVLVGDVVAFVAVIAATLDILSVVEDDLVIFHIDGDGLAVHIVQGVTLDIDGRLRHLCAEGLIVNRLGWRNLGVRILIHVLHCIAEIRPGSIVEHNVYRADRHRSDEAVGRFIEGQGLHSVIPNEQGIFRKHIARRQILFCQRREGNRIAIVEILVLFDQELCTQDTI